MKWFHKQDKSKEQDVSANECSEVFYWNEDSRQLTPFQMADNFLMNYEKVRHNAYEITNCRREAHKLRDLWLWTGDLALYTMENGGTLYLASRQNNLVAIQMKSATTQLVQTGVYQPSEKEVRSVKNASNTLQVAMKELNLKTLDSDNCYFEFETSNLASLSRVQRKLVERAYGIGKDLDRNINMFRESGIHRSGVYVASPDFIQRRSAPNGSVALLCRLADFRSGSHFYCMHMPLTMVFAPVIC